jgi:hypothetical protein
LVGAHAVALILEPGSKTSQAPTRTEFPAVPSIMQLDPPLSPIHYDLPDAVKLIGHLSQLMLAPAKK